jgi:hypothetical protein
MSVSPPPPVKVVYRSMRNDLTKSQPDIRTLRESYRQEIGWSLGSHVMLLVPSREQKRFK